jgi:DNA-binding transcriptional ArsR family regulator
MSLDGHDPRSPGLTGESDRLPDLQIASALTAHADAVAGFLKAMSHPGRLMILSHLASRERSVTELEGLLGQRQAAVSQQLARLRLEGLVQARRDGKTIHYALKDARVAAFLRALTALFDRDPASLAR